ncbi:MAG TPA: MATE family efflux transporter, partial [Ruminococcaceae bacterium]|nr:MATE family efflux transporter [Oscillospiraceae bacterium]
AEKTASLGVLLATVSGIVLAAISMIFVQPISALLGGSASEGLLDCTVSYMIVICVGIPFQMLSTTVYNQLRLCGNIKDGMIGMGVGMLGNLLLDPLFILGFDMGIMGAGVASTVGQIASCIVLYIISAKHGNITMRFFSFDLQNKRLYHILLGGAPNFSRQSITSIASILLNNAAVPYGPSLIAAMTVSTRVSSAAYLLMIGFGQGFQPICAINYGAKQYDRVKAAFRMTVTIGTVFLAIAGILIAIFAEPLTAAFSSSDPEVTEKAALMVRLQCISFPFMPFYAVSGMYMQNVGMYIRSLFISIMRQGIVFIPLLFIMPAIWGEWGIFTLQPVSDILSFLVSVGIIMKAKIDK